MKRLTLFLGLVPLLSVPRLPAGESRTVDVLEDTWIDGLGSNSTSGGTANNLGICPSADYWIYLKFDLSLLEGQIDDAELRMVRFNGSRPQEIALYFIEEDSWTEATLTGVSRPEPSAPDPADTLAVGEETDGYDRWTSAELTSVVREEARGDGTLSLMLREDPHPELDVRRFCSREAGIGCGEKPQLVVTLSGINSEETVAEGWQTVEIGPGTKPAFDFGPDGRVHVMAMTESFDGEVWYAAAESFDGPWSPRPIAQGYFYGPGDLIVDDEGTAHLAWHNHDEADANHATVDAEGSVRTYPIVTPATHNGWDNSLAVDAEGQLHMASVNPSGFGATTSLEYAVFLGGQWSHFEVPGSGSFMYGLATSIAIDDMGRTHIAYCQSDDWTTPGDLKYAVGNTEEWDISSVVTGGPRGRFPSLTVDHWNRPHLAWLDVDENNPSRAIVRYGVLNAGKWEIEDVDVLENVDLSHSGARKSVSLVLDRIWSPHVAYGDTRFIRYAVRPFGEWKITQVLENEEETYKGLVILRLDGNERPAIAFWQSDPPPGLVRFALGPAGTVEPFQLPGDCTQDAVLDISDAVCLLGNLFLGSPAALPCGDGTAIDPGNVTLLDQNGDDGVDISDAVHVLTFLFLGGSPPLLGLDCVVVDGCPPSPGECG